jgi:hypothetical protein
VWAPNVVHGLLQTADYAAALLSTYPGVTDEVLKARVANRMERQRRVLLRKDPPVTCLLVDHAALYREVGSAEVMTGQMARLAETAELAHVTLQVVPAVAHPATSSELIIADDVSAYAEHLVAGGVYTDDEAVNSLRRVFDRLRGESYRTSESRAVIAKAGQTWNAAGASRHTPEPTAVHA